MKKNITLTIFLIMLCLLALTCRGQSFYAFRSQQAKASSYKAHTRPLDKSKLVRRFKAMKSHKALRKRIKFEARTKPSPPAYQKHDWIREPKY